MSAVEWAFVEAMVARLITEGPRPFTAEAMAHVDDFLKYLRERTLAPSVGPGYYQNTLEIWWDCDASTEPCSTVQFVVHPKMIEVYSFSGRHVTGIQEIPHVTGEPFPQEIDATLPPKGETG